MRILHTADLHLGQILYNNYKREDEHRHFFNQLKKWVTEYRPDALIVSGDIFDVPRPATSVWEDFTNTFVDLHSLRPEMKIIIVAGNHDSPSVIQSHSGIWRIANTTMIGAQPPVIDKVAGWEENYIIRLKSGYIIALPYMGSNRTDVYEHLLAYCSKENENDLPIVITGHLAVSGSDFTGHSDQVGNLKSIDVAMFGNEFDYMALGHIHRPQTIGYPEDLMATTSEYMPPVVRYSGSPLHVSSDEAFPHSVSLVDLESRGDKVKITQLKIDQLRHFRTLPEDAGKSYGSEKEALKDLKRFAKENDNCYVRLRMDFHTDLSTDFNNQVYQILEADDKDLRYNPKIIWTGGPESDNANPNDEAFQISVEELQQMTDPLDFVLNTLDDYPTISSEELRAAFSDVEDYIRNHEV